MGLVEAENNGKREASKGDDTMSFLPLDHPDRIALEKTLAEFRELESAANTYPTDRNGIEYIEHLFGIGGFLRYAALQNPGGTILDVGAGTTRGMRDIEKFAKKESIDLQFEATVLVRPPSAPEFLDPDKIRETSVEMLEGIPDSSITGIIALHSVTHSRFPGYAMRRIDKVLVPGGVFKGAFVSDVWNRIQGATRFTPTLHALGYNVSYYNDDFFLAIKPGGKGKMSAEELFREDRRSMASQKLVMLE